MEKKEQVYAFIKDKQYVPMKKKEIAQILMVPKEETKALESILEELEREYKIRRNRKNQYMIIQGEYMQGMFRRNQKGFGFVVGEEDEEIHIASEKTGSALDGDMVIVKRIKDGQREGRIVKILKRETKELVGTFQAERNFGFVIPDNNKLGTDVYISKKHFKGAKNGNKVLVKITKYPEKGKNAEGTIEEIIGNMDEVGVDITCLVREYHLPYEFPKPVLEEAEHIRPEIEKKDIPNRVDLRDQLIFTIDGEDAKDLDDAVCVKKLENGNYQLGVHIADVSYYVKEGSMLDQEAYRRGTSIYLLDRVIPMLPTKLSNGICSLNQGEDRFSLSVQMEIDEKGNVIDAEVFKGIICVTRRMSYTEVTKLLENPEDESVKPYKKYKEAFQNMQELAKILQAKRKIAGGLTLDIPESKIVLDEQGRAVQVGICETTFSHSIIEQFMLTANETIAEKFYWLDLPFIYRVHEMPSMDKIKELNTFLFDFGYRIKTKQEEVHPQEFNKILENLKGKPEERMLSILLLRTLKVAKYENQNKGHFGIASKYYCHFTSPIRRYPDLWIHRMISKYIEKGYVLTQEKKEIYEQIAQKVAEQSSQREAIAQKVERDSIDLKKAEYMQDKIGEVYEGRISGVTNFGIFVELDNTVEGLIRFENLGEKEYFIYDEVHKHIIGEKSNRVYKLGDVIQVRVIEASKEIRKIAFEKVEEEVEEITPKRKRKKKDITKQI